MESVHTSVLERIMGRMLLSDTIGSVFLQFKNRQQEAADQSITALRHSYLKTHARLSTFSPVSACRPTIREIPSRKREGC
jgi:hypothetical protein